jgi:peptidoglycan/xylan/chitin deacetylase (PgdA/CDA1 family)
MIVKVKVRLALAGRRAAWMLIRYCGLPWIVRNLLARNKVTIVVYHDPPPDILQTHLSYLKRRYTIVPLDTVVHALTNNSWSDLPHKSLVVTFDDGHVGNYRVLPVLQTSHVVPTIYLCAGIINSTRRFWWSDVGQPERQLLKKLDNAERIARLKERYGYSPTREYPPASRQGLNAKELLEMVPFVDFGAHSLSHPILTQCSDTECKQEILASKKQIEKLLCITCRHFSYPNGDYDDREATLVKEAGYLSARATTVGWVGPHSDPYRLKCIGIADTASITQLVAQMTGLPALVKQLAGGRLRRSRTAV